MNKRMLVLLFVLVCFCGCAWLANVVPDVSPDQAEVLANAASTTAGEAVAGKNGPLAGLAAGGSAGAAVYGLLSLLAWFKRKYGKKVA